MDARKGRREYRMPCGVGEGEGKVMVAGARGIKGGVPEHDSRLFSALE